MNSFTWSQMHGDGKFDFAEPPKPDELTQQEDGSTIPIKAWCEKDYRGCNGQSCDYYTICNYPHKQHFKD